MADASIFICHAGPDAAFARDLALALETCRLSVWRDIRDVRGVDRLLPEARWAIEQARQTIVVLGLNTGHPTWLRREIELAQEMERRRSGDYRLVPLLLPGTDNAVLGQWFAPLPRCAPIHLPAEGLSAILPELLAALGETFASHVPGERSSAALTELELDFSPQPADAKPDGWRWQARLRRESKHPPLLSDHLGEIALPKPLPRRLLDWYLQSHPCWPTDTLRHLARRVETALAKWGRSLHAATLEAAGASALAAAWREASPHDERRLAIRADAGQPGAASLLELPWELLCGPAGFLVQGKRPVQFVRRLPGGGAAFAAVPPPLRLLAISPRPDTEPTGHPDYRRSALPLLDALDGLGALTETRLLVPPTLGALEKRLNDAWAAGRPFTVLHLDAYLRDDLDSQTILVGFEASYELHTPICREAHFIAAKTLASLLTTYCIRLVVLCPSSAHAFGDTATVGFVATLLQAGIAAVVTVQAETPQKTQQRFWAGFYEELLGGATVSHALAAGQRRLAQDSYRASGLGGGGVHLQDWFCFRLYLADSDPRCCLRPPLELWRRLAETRAERTLALNPPPTGFIGRARDLLRLERLLEERAAVFLRGPGGVGKTAAAVTLAAWLNRCGRYDALAYASAGDASDPRTLLETLGRQLWPEGDHWSVSRYPSLWRALDDLRKNLQARPTLIVLDQLDYWPSENEAAFDLFWKDFSLEWPALRALGLGRLGPPSFASPWAEAKLSAMDDRDAIALMAQTLIAAGEMPPPGDSGNGFQPLREMARLAAGYPAALQRLAREIGAQGVNATLGILQGPLRSELLRRHGDDPQWPLFLNLELALRHLPADERERLNILAFFKDGANRIALGKALELDTQPLETFCERLLALGLVDEQGQGYLRFDAPLSYYLSGQLSSEERALWRQRWRAGMDQWLEILYQQFFKDNARTTRLLRLEIPNLLNLLRDQQQQSDPEQTAFLAIRLEQLLANLGMPAALAEIVSARERAGQALSGWSRIRFETERLGIERLRDEGSLELALQAARKLLRLCESAGDEPYPGARYDRARTHFQLGKLLKLTGAAEPAVRELSEARQQFQRLAGAGNANAGRMAAVAEAEIGDCLIFLQRLQEAAAAYEAAIAQAGAGNVDLTLAANQMQLGLVRQRQGLCSEAVALYDSARRLFETLGEIEGVARAWRQLALAYKLNGDLAVALQACQQALYLHEQQHNRNETAEVLGELGHLHLALSQLEEAASAYRRMADLCAQLGDGHGEELARNNLANALIQLRRHDEARQELYRASECNLPESYTARHWAIRRGLHDVGQESKNVEVADQARQQAMRKYLAYRRAGGKNTNPGARLCEQIGQGIRAGHTAELSAILGKMAASSTIPAAGQALISKLQAILDGSRDPALADDPDLHYQYAVELQLLFEQIGQQ
ncbi:MAG: TIR domain-containing protein [Candidatus Competibacteraceae bacterium]|nr:TIR domain-containing protein [Candidatus Competibacteraceae bacterium]